MLRKGVLAIYAIFYFLSLSFAIADDTNTTTVTVTANEEYVERASQRTFGVSTKSLSDNRGEDAKFTYAPEETCCCKDEILGMFSDRTERENSRVNPATDTMLKSLAEYEKTIRYAIKQVLNLRQINAMYSYPQMVMMRPDTNTSTPTTYSGKGCEPIDPSNPADMDKYLAFMDQFENSASDGAYSLLNEKSGAYGRYQFIPSTAAMYCGRTATANCCSDWHGSPQCQDEMYAAFTEDNMADLASKGVPLNTCTVYLTHQQGLGGFMWIMGGKNPYSGISGLQNAIKMNVGEKTWNDLVASGANIEDEEVLRTAYKDFWNKKFGGNIDEAGAGEAQHCRLPILMSLQPEPSNMPKHKDHYGARG